MVGGAYIARHPPHVSRVLLRLAGTGPAAVLVQELGPAQVAAEPEDIDPATGKHLTGAVQQRPGTARGIARVRGAGPVAGPGLREVRRGIGRFAAGLSSCGCS